MYDLVLGDICVIGSVIIEEILGGGGVKIAIGCQESLYESVLLGIQFGDALHLFDMVFLDVLQDDGQLLTNEGFRFCTHECVILVFFTQGFNDVVDFGLVH